MLVTFHSNAWGSVTLFGDVAVTLLKMAGHSGTVPSALLAGDIPSAIARLQKGLAAADPEAGSRKGVRPGVEDSDAASPVGIRLRAYPLIELLSASARQGCDVMWEAGAPVI